MSTQAICLLLEYASFSPEKRTPENYALLRSESQGSREDMGVLVDLGLS